MSSSKDKDPLSMGELDPGMIHAAIEEKKKKAKPPSELELQKEKRLSEKENRLTMANKYSSEVKPPAESVKPTPVDPSVLLDKIAAYRDRFPELKSRNPKISAKSSVEEMEDEIHYLELQLGTKKDGNLGVMLFVGSMVGLESLTQQYNPLGLNLQGLGQVARDNIAEFTPILDELTIKYGASMYVQPEVRLAFAIGAMVVTVHSANSGDSRLGEALKRMSAPVKPPNGSDKM